MRAGKSTRWVFAIAAAIGVAIAAHAGFEDDYILGLKALERGRLAEARQYLQHAFDAQPSSIEEINLNGNMQPYLPLHFLGVVAYRSGDCAAAESYWNNPANKRMLARLNLLRKQEQQSMADCKPVAKELAATAASVPETAAKPVETQNAGASIEKTKPSVSEPVAKPVTTPKIAEAKPAVVAEKPVVTPPPKPEPPDALVQALQNYLAGHYAVAARIDPATIADRRAKFHALLIRAAARYMLASTGEDATMLDAAHADVRAAHELDPRSSPDAATFPPRFLAFYSATR